MGNCLRVVCVACFVILMLCSRASATEPDHATYKYAKLRPAARQAVTFGEGFWKPRVDAGRTAGMRAVLDEYLTGKSAYIVRNFKVAAGKVDEPRQGGKNSDEFLYKLMEAASYYAADEGTEQIVRDLDRIIDVVLAAQLEDGYLNTWVTATGKKRFSTESWMEYYYGGHLVQAGIAHRRITGETRLFDAARKYIDLLHRETSPPDRWPFLTEPTGAWPYKFKHEERLFVQRHPDAEMALVELYRETGDKKYLDFSRLIMEDGENYLERQGLVSHAVKETLLNVGAIDYYLESGDRRFFDQVRRMWADLNRGKMYVTGGVGARHAGEAYGDNYELPNRSAYAETCAAISNVFWQWRLLLATGEAKYADLMERVLYNGFLAGVSLRGTKFFYRNPLSRRGGNAAEQPEELRHTYWGCSCCPPNVQRLFASLQTYVYTATDSHVGVHLYTGSTLRHTLPGDARLTLVQKTNYPWSEDVQIDVTLSDSVALDKPARFTLSLRIPGWCHGASAELNGQAIKVEPRGGYYLEIDRTWRGGEAVRLRLPMPPRIVPGDHRVSDQIGRLAILRGPIVYCLESHDNPGADLDQIIVPKDIELSARFEPDLLSGVVTLSGEAQLVRHAVERAETTVEKTTIKAIPYYAWANREPCDMDVWLACDPAILPRPKPPTIASQSRVAVSFQNRGQARLDPGAVNDQIDPAGSGDDRVPRFHWWPHLGTTEWVQYDFGRPAKVSAVEVYWLDDTGRGACRVPASWRLLHKTADGWQEVSGASNYGVAKDRFNRTTFTPIESTAVRIEARLRQDAAAGVLEWRVE